MSSKMFSKANLLRQLNAKNASRRAKIWRRVSAIVPQSQICNLLPPHIKKKQKVAEMSRHTMTQRRRKVNQKLRRKKMSKHSR